MSDEQQKEVPVTKQPAKPAAAAKEDAPPDPRTIAAQEVLDVIRGKIEAKFGGDVLEETKLAKYRPTFVVKCNFWDEVITFLKEEPTLGFAYLECMAGTDYPTNGYIEVVAYLQSVNQDRFICVKVRAERDNPILPSITPVFKGVDCEEREIYDLLGVTFIGHPDLRRIMLPDDWKGHPLRKDYSVMD